MVRYDSIDLLSFIVYGEVRQYRLTFVHRDDDDDDDDDDEDDDYDDDDDEVLVKLLSLHRLLYQEMEKDPVLKPDNWSQLDALEHYKTERSLISVTV